MKNKSVFLLYLGLTLVMTFPMVVKPFWFKVDELYDLGTQIWNFWIIKDSLIHWHIDPFRNDYWYYGQGTNLIVQNPVTFYSLLSIPFQALLPDLDGIALSTNLILIFSTALSGFGTYLYGTHRGMSKQGAFVAGLIFAFSPFRFWHFGRFHITCTEFLPFFLLFFEKAIDSEESGRRKFPLATGLVFTFAVYSSLMHATYLMLMGFAILVRELTAKRVTLKGIVRPISIMIGVAVCLGSIYIFEFILYLGTHYVEVGEPVEAMSRYSANLLGYFIPARNLNLLGGLGFINKALVGIGGDEIYVGFSAIILAVPAIMGVRKKTGNLRFWVILMIVFFVISLGPNLNVLSTQASWHMPQYYLAKYIPIFSMDRAPVRYAVLVEFCLAMLAGYGVTRIIEGSARQSLKTALPILAALAILIDFNQSPLLMRAVHVPSFYHEIALDKEICGVYEIPPQLPFARRLAMTYAVVHKKKLLMSGGRSKTKRYEVIEHPFFYGLISPQDLIDDPQRDEKIEANRRYLLGKGIKYIVLHEKLSPAEYVEPWKKYIELHKPVETMIDGPSRAYRMY